MSTHKIYSMSFSRIYPEYINKAERKQRTKAEVDEIISWLTGYSVAELNKHLSLNTTVEDFLMRAPMLNPARSLITGVVCGVRIEDIEDPIMKEIRYLDKLINELAKGRPMEKILRKP